MIVGAKLLGFIAEAPQKLDVVSFSKVLELFDKCPIVFYGGLLGAVSGGFAYVKISENNPRTYLNALAPAYPIFHAFGRVGCFFAGCCYGIPCSWGIAMAETPDVKRVPVQLIEAAFEMLVFVILILLDRKKRNEHNLTALYLAMYAPFRFVTEFFRGDEVRGFIGPLSTSQWISVIIIIVLIIKACVDLNLKKKMQKNC